MKKISSPLAGQAARTGGAGVVPKHSGAAPGWLWWALLAGAVVVAAWTWFVFGFLSEPSVVGRILAVFVVYIALSVVAALAGAVGALGLVLGEPSGRTLAWIAATTLTLTGIGAIAGIPALIGLVSSRGAGKP